MKDHEIVKDSAAICGISSAMIKGLLLVQEKWALLIVHRLMKGPLGFNELNRQADGVNTTTLCQRLTLLEQVGVIVKTVHSTMPPRTSYELTEAGHALQPLLAAIEVWSEKYLTGIERPSACTEAAFNRDSDHSLA